MLHINHHWRHGLLGGADVRECGDDWLDFCWQGCQHRVVEGEGEDAWEGGAATAANAGCHRVDGDVELPEEVYAQDGPLHIRCDEGEVALVYGRLAVLEVKCEGSLGTGGDGCAVGGGEQAALL